LEQNPERSEPGTLPGFKRTADEIVLLQHSSGTTGLQKGVALSHQAIFNQLHSYAEALRMRSDDVIVSWLPLYHDMGLIAGFSLPILSRIPLVLMSPFDWVRAPQRLMQATCRYRGTLTWLPNFAYNFCAQKVRPSQLEGVDLTSWRAVINCSEPMHWASHQMFLERFRPFGLRSEALATCYAMAENVFAVTQGGIEAPVTVDTVDGYALVTLRRAVSAGGSKGTIAMLSAGLPIKNTRLRILDAKGGDLPERHIGEIAIQSDCMLSGYFRRPDLTEKAFRDGWYLSGDLGYLAGGELYITGRKKDLIIVGGKNIYPQDLERLASDVPGVHPGRAVAFGVFNAEMGTEEVVMLVESDDDDPAIHQAIAEQIRLRVTRGSDVVLRIVQVVERGWLLKTSSGKIARSANREKYLNEKAPLP
jgi:acyl-CoA synthetase (AMP-forming)/AMP-acid ligase II